MALVSTDEGIVDDDQCEVCLMPLSPDFECDFCANNPDDEDDDAEG